MEKELTKIQKRIRKINRYLEKSKVSLSEYLNIHKPKLDYLCSRRDYLLKN